MSAQWKATIGPWLFCEISEEITSKQRIRDGKAAIATVEIGWNEPSQSEQLANARLIAAAPSLLDALQALLRAVRCNDENGRPRTADEIYAMAGPDAQAAIAKATGEPT